MSKYNYGASIPIESLSKEELEQALKEWLIKEKENFLASFNKNRGL